MSVADELQKLADLMEKGLVTRDEFEAEKARLLGGGRKQSAAPEVLADAVGAVAGGLAGDVVGEVANILTFPYSEDELASPGQRLGAAFIDNLIGLAAVVTCIGLPAFFVFNLMLLSTTGQTWGKREMKIRIVHLDGSPPSFLRTVFLRGIPQGIAAATTAYTVGLLILLADHVPILFGTHQALHDRLAKTAVIRVADKEPIPKQVLTATYWTLGISVAFALLIMLLSQ